MDSDRKRGSLKGLSLDELKRSTTTSSPPAVYVHNKGRPNSVTSCSSVQAAGTASTVERPVRDGFDFTSSARQIHTPSRNAPVKFGTPVSTSSHTSFDFIYPSMVREQEPARSPLGPSPANTQPSFRNMDKQETKAQGNPLAFSNNIEPQNVPSPQPVFGRPTQLGGSAQPFSRQPLFERTSGAGQHEGKPGTGNNHLFISNKSGNKRPDYHKPQAIANPLQALHRPPPGGNPLSQMNSGPNRPTTNTQNSMTAHRPRNTRVIDSSDDDDDVFEIPKPANFPTWQPKPFVHPTFSSTQNTNPYFQPKPTTATFMNKTALAANTVADGGIWEDRYNTADPSIYLDSGKANEELKALFEGSVEDEDDKPRTRRKKKELEEKLGGLANQMGSLDVKGGVTKAEEQQEDEEAEEEDDDTVEGLKVKLLPHQIEGVEWMKIKERGGAKGKGMTKGGILADDMGLGKTIQSIALMLTNKPPAVAPEKKSDVDIVYDKCTLIVAPLALIKQWEAELKDRVELSHSFKICVHHGPQRAKSFKDLKKYDIVITTYQTLSSEHAACSERIRAGCFGVDWYRVILDEAHTIKNRNAKVSKAACALEAKYRWCLTGTPMQNNVDELQSLIHFLQIGPLDKIEFWKSRIVQPMNSGRGGLAIKRLHTALKGLMKRRTKDVLKQNGALKNGDASEQVEKTNDAGFKIVKRTVEKVEVEFTREERAFYTRLESRIDSNLEKMMASKKVNYASALVLLLRLRQACNHAKLLGFDLAGERDALGDGAQTPRKKAGGGAGDVDDLTTMLGGLNVEMKRCDICQTDLSKEEVEDGALRCRDCEEDLSQQTKSSKLKKQKKKETAAIVKNDRKIKRNVIVDSDDEDGSDGGDSNKVDFRSRNINVENGSGEDDDDENDDDTGTDEDEDDDDDDEYSSSEEAPIPIVASTKIRHLLSILRNDSHTHKYIVFSFFTSMLDLIEPFLYQHHIKFTRYDGSMRNDAREASLHSLRNNPTTRVLLCSLRAGSLGLNLTAASRVVVLEPFWNPFVEEQAIDRVHRLNQTQDVVVYKLTIKDTVEARILELQEKKRELARVTVEGGAGVGKGGVAKLTLAEMMKLFDHTSEQAAVIDMLGMKGGKSLLDRGERTDVDDGDGEDRDNGLYGEMSSQRLWRGAASSKGKSKDLDRDRERRKKEHEVYGRRW